MSTNFATRTNVDTIARNLIATHMEQSSSSTHCETPSHIDYRVQHVIHPELTRDSPINQSILDEIRRATETIVHNELAPDSEFGMKQKFMIRRMVRDNV